MQAAAASDPGCAPNVITYSALMTACCAGGRPDAAQQVFRGMRAAGVQPDHITYSTLLAGALSSILPYLQKDEVGGCHAGERSLGQGGLQF